MFVNSNNSVLSNCKQSMATASESPQVLSENLGDGVVVDMGDKRDMMTYLENIFRSAIDDGQTDPTGAADNEHETIVVNTPADEDVSQADSSSSYSDAENSSDSSESEDSVQAFVPKRKRKIVLEKQPPKPYKYTKLSETTHLTDYPVNYRTELPVNVVIPIFTCSHDDMETLLRKERVYIHGCVRTHQPQFGKTGRIALWRQLGVELGYSYVDLVSIGEKIVRKVPPGRRTPTQPPSFLPQEDEKIVCCVEKYAGGGIGIWDTLAPMFNCTAFEVRQRWSVLVPVLKQQELVQRAVQRRRERMAMREETASNHVQRSSSEVQSSVIVPPPSVVAVAHPSTTYLQRHKSNQEVIQLVSQEVQRYNNVNSRLNIWQFWKALSKHLDKNRYLVDGVTPLVRNKHEWHIELEKWWKKLCDLNPRSKDTFVLCQPKTTSDMNAVIYYASVKTLSHFVRPWWRKHLYHKPFQVYNACAQYVQMKAPAKMRSDHTVERVLNVLFAVVLSVEADQQLDTDDAVPTHNVFLPPVLFNATKANVYVPPLPVNYDRLITHTALSLQALPPALAAVRWNQLAKTCCCSVLSVQRRWRWLSGRANSACSSSGEKNFAADTCRTNDYVLVVPETVDDNYW